MIRQLELIERPPLEKDIVYTPDKIAYEIIEWLHPSGICLDPCRGDGAFYRNLPQGSEWCEIEVGRNFFDYDKSVDWIIGNPPYSCFEAWLAHSFELAQEIAYILPTNKIFQRQLIMKMINEWGGIKGLMVYGSGTMVGFHFGFSVGTFHFKKNYHGESTLILKTS